MSLNVILVGLDGVDLELLQPWIETGELPHFETILSDGAYTDLETCPPCWTIPNWNVISTGKTPGTLGIYDFMSYDRQNHASLPYFTIQGDGNPLWRYIEINGGKSCIANLPSLHTPTEMEGISLVGWLPANKDELTYPPSLQVDLHDLVDGYRLDVKSVNIEEGEVSSDWDNKQEFLDELYALTEDRIEVFNYLFDMEDWDFFMPVFTGTDRINHALWDEEEDLLNYYKRIDEWMGDVLKSANDDTIIGFVSDHGFSGHDKTLYFNELLEDLGFLTRESSKKETRVNFISQLVNSGRKYLPDAIKSVIPGKLRRFLTSLSETPFYQANIVWENTSAYCTSVSGTVYVETGNGSNHQERVVTALEQALHERGLDPDTFRIYQTSNLYDNLKGDAPELIVEFDNVDINTGFRESKDDWLISKPVYGNHQRTGMLALYGPGVRNCNIKSASVIDVAPTVLYLLDAPIPTDVDGNILFELLTTDKDEELLDELWTDPLSTNESTSVTDKGAVEDRLESLGYL